jgi:hypothetical protein
MGAGARRTARFTPEQALFIAETPGIDEATQQSIWAAAATMSSVTLDSRQLQQLIRAVGRRLLGIADWTDNRAMGIYHMVESIIDALAPESVRRGRERSTAILLVDPTNSTEH